MRSKTVRIGKGIPSSKQCCCPNESHTHGRGSSKRRCFRISPRLLLSCILPLGNRVRGLVYLRAQKGKAKQSFVATSHVGQYLTQYAGVVSIELFIFPLTDRYHSRARVDSPVRKSGHQDVFLRHL